MTAGADVIVVGSGLAGLTAALELSRAGRGVVVLEGREVFGGRVSSWNDAGMEVDAGIHRYLGFYASLPQLLTSVGVRLADIVVWEDEIEIRLPDGGPRAVIGGALLHQPHRILRTIFGNNNWLSAGDRRKVLRFFAAGLLAYWRHPEELDNTTVAAFAAKQGLSEKVIHRLLVPLTSGVFFLPPDQHSAFAHFSSAAMAMKRPHAFRVGAFTQPMGEAFVTPIVEAIERAGGEVRPGSRVERLISASGGVGGVVTDGQELIANHVIVATALGAAQGLVRECLGDHPWFQPMLELKVQPALSIQIELSEAAMESSRTVFGPGTCMGSFSEQSTTTFRHVPGRLSVVLDPPERYIHMELDGVLEAVCRDAARLGLPIADLVTDARLVRHPDEFYAMTPGSNALRPPQATPVPGLTLAGDYTEQPYLSTMEGAVVSGLQAARACMGKKSKRTPSTGPKVPL